MKLQRTSRIVLGIVVLIVALIVSAASAEEAKLLGSNSAVLDEFGFAVSIDGDRALVGARYADNPFPDSGSAYIFDFNGTNWTETIVLAPNDLANVDSFGWSVALDGDRALIGSPFDDDNGSASGSAYVFEFDGSTWSQTAKITPALGSSNVLFGWSVALDGNRALIGTPTENIGGLDTGSVIIFEFDGSTWQEITRLNASDGVFNENFGWSVSLDGNRALIGSIEANGNAPDSGGAHIFEYDGSAWSEIAKLTANDGADQDRFGASVSLDGDYAVIGAFQDDDNDTDSGSTYVFEFDGSNWTQAAKLTASDGDIMDNFGEAVSVKGNVAVIGASFGDDGVEPTGAVYVFERNGSGVWSEIEKINATDAAPSDDFGTSVSFDGNRALIGARFDNDSGTDSGSAYVFSIESSALSLGNCFIDAPASVNEGDSFTSTVTCNGTTDVYGFEYDQSVDPSSPIITEQTTTFSNGNIFNGLSTLTLVNDIIDGYAQSLQAPETPVSGNVTLGNLAYDTDDPGIATLNLDLLILGNISGQSIPVNISGSTQVIINDLALASISGTARRETGADITSAITVLADGASPDSTGTAGGFFTFAYDEEAVALDATLTVNAPGHVSCLTPDLGLTDDTLNILTPITLLAGDVDNNDTVDITDGSIIVQERFLPGSAPAGTTPDLNEDGNINILDIIHVGRNFSTVGPSACQ